MISDDTVERVRSAADIVQIIGEFVPLKRSGGDYRGACPFHQGTHPNFSVSPKRGQYYCFVCHESGDIITFLRKRLNLDFTSAVKWLGERTGIDVVDTPARQRAPDPNERHWEVLAAAAGFYHDHLQTPAGTAAREYLQRREVSNEAVARFAIGFAPRDGQLLVKHMAALGFDADRLRDAGLMVAREEHDEMRVRFRGRLMFPILDERGHTVGFGGRALGDEQPKYLNSADSDVFHKRHVLYGMHVARQAARSAGRLLVVEGYLDVLRVMMAGIEEVVAPLGTALTEEQAATIARYAPEVFLLYDSDEAGLKATFRSGIELLRHGVTVRVASLPEGEDPDSYVRQHGAPGLERALREAVDVFDLQIDLLTRKGWFATLHQRRRAVDKLLPTIRATRDAIQRDLYIGRLAEASQLDRGIVAQEASEEAVPRSGSRTTGGRGANGAPAVDGGGGDASVPADESPSMPRRPWVPSGQWRGRGRSQGPEWLSTAAPPRAGVPDASIEQELVRAMLLDRGTVDRVAERYGPDAFRDAGSRVLFQRLLKAGADASLDRVADGLPAEGATLLEALQARGDAPVDVGWGLLRLQRRDLDDQIAALRGRIEQAPPEEQPALLEEQARLAKERQALLASLRGMRAP